MNPLFVFVPIAQRDVDFYIHTAKKLQKAAFTSLFQPGNEQIEQAGFKNYDLYSYVRKLPYNSPSIPELERRFGIENLQAICLHEKVTFNIHDDNKLHTKFAQYLNAAEMMLDDIDNDFPGQEKVLTQELAGFLGPMALHFAALKRGWKSRFAEPAFFKGRILLNDGLMEARLNNLNPIPAETKSAVTDYINQALNTKTVVAAKKDAHHFRDMGLSKVFNLMNFTKLWKKLWAKYVLRQQQEFEHIWNHTRRYLGMLINRWRNAGHYTQSLQQLPQGKKILYFPFHVQLDFALTIRSPEFLDQLGLVEKITQTLPSDYILIAKEHPASVGCLNQARLTNILSTKSNFFLLHPQVNSHDITECSSAIVTINSKVGAESLLYNKAVFSFGKAFYTGRGYTYSCDKVNDIVKALKSEQKLTPNQDSEISWNSFLEIVWQNSWPVELYELSTENVKNFAEALTESCLELDSTKQALEVRPHV